jgi:hypothetical protein
MWFYFTVIISSLMKEVFKISNIKSDICKEYENRTSSNYIRHIVNKQHDSNVADFVDAADDGPLRPKHVVLRV